MTGENMCSSDGLCLLDDLAEDMLFMHGIDKGEHRCEYFVTDRTQKYKTCSNRRCFNRTYTCTNEEAQMNAVLEAL